MVKWRQSLLMQKKVISVFYAINFLFRCSFWYPKSAFVAYVYLIILISFFVCRKAI